MLKDKDNFPKSHQADAFVKVRTAHFNKNLKNPVISYGKSKPV